MLCATACGSGAAADPNADQAGVAPGAAHDAASRSTEADRIEVTLTGPAFPGRHEVTSGMQCHATAGIWQATYESNRTAGLSGALVMLQGVPASGGASEQVTANLVFGQVTDDVDPNAGMVDLHARALGGDATGSVRREGRGAVLTIEGTSANAGKVTVTVHCASVDIVD